MDSILQADKTSETFTSLYYDTIDKKRNIIHKLYHDNATLIWNGNHYQGLEAIKTFFEQIPTSEHKTDCLDAQPITPNVTNGQTSITLNVHGIVSYDENSSNRRLHPPKLMGFNQSFILIAEGDKWKIISDWVRTHDCDKVQ
ncbi:unnamed protein product [Gordionus sp. m RMFG-2023]|uniref:NTF2-related export protein-like isoform X1 n=1 Tax=Gordionus sp. m RMFG-2023 TaxID=3053472 RepID=UPI0030E06A60